jgi:hypothetical protein
VDDEPQRVCPCGLSALEDGDHVRCPAHEAIPRWAVALGGQILYPAPRMRAVRSRLVAA